MNLFTELKHEIHNTRIEEDAAWHIKIHPFGPLFVQRHAVRRARTMLKHGTPAPARPHQLELGLVTSKPGTYPNDCSHEHDDEQPAACDGRKN
jgi:hypothetical protein